MVKAKKTTKKSIDDLILQRWEIGDSQEQENLRTILNVIDNRHARKGTGVSSPHLQDSLNAHSESLRGRIKGLIRAANDVRNEHLKEWRNTDIENTKAQLNKLIEGSTGSLVSDRRYTQLSPAQWKDMVEREKDKVWEWAVKLVHDTSSTCNLDIKNERRNRRIKNLGWIIPITILVWEIIRRVASWLWSFSTG